MSLLIIFGAGASYESVPARFVTAHAMYQPPLTRELADARFVERIQTPHCEEIIAEIRGGILAGRGVEEELERLATEPITDHTRKQLLSISYYIRDVIATCEHEWVANAKGATNYAGLLSALERWREPDDRIEIVTFNYDRLLENALGRLFGRDFRQIERFAFDKTHGVFKLHGSVDWCRVVRRDRETSISDLIEDAADLEVSPYFLTEQEWSESDSFGARVPALAIPTLTKSSFQCPIEHQQLLREQLPKIDRVLVVGWAGREVSFTTMLGQLLPEGVEGLIVCEGMEAAQTTASILQAAVPQGTFHAAPIKGFSLLLGSDLLGQLLS